MALLPQSLIAAFVFLVTLVAVPVAAQHHQDWQHGSHHHWSPMAPMYDARAEIRVRGVVEVVDNAAHSECGCCGPGGATFLTLKTTTESIDVHLGSTAFLQEKNIRLAAGDDLEIVGSRIATMGGASFLLARQLLKGDATWTLRDASGRALWSGGCR
jgi:hypothetical protein